MIELFLGINLYVWLFVQFCGSRLEFYALGQNRIERKGEKRRGGGGVLKDIDLIKLWYFTF